MSAISIEQAYNDELLDEKIHSRLVADIDRVSAIANIPVGMILRSMKDFCSQEEIEWVIHFHARQAEDKPNLAYCGNTLTAPIESRMMAMGGALLRNFIDARIYTAQELINSMDKNTVPNPTVLMIPNFFVGKNNGGHMASWHVSALLGLLITRLAAKRTTVIYIDNWQGLESEYGSAFTQHIKHHFNLIK